MSAPLTILYDNHADVAELSGGDWVDSDTIKLSNLQTPYMSEIARSASAEAEDTQFVVALDRTRQIGGIALGAVSVRPDATWRIRIYDDAELTELVHDSGEMDLPGVIVDSTELEWESDNFWEGIPDDFDDIFRGGVDLIYLPGENVIAQYVLVNLYNETHPKGYIDIGRLMVGTRWSPLHNYSYGSNSLSFEDQTDEEESRNGTKFFHDRNMRRVFGFAFQYLPDVQTIRDIYHMATRARRSRQIVVIPFPDDPPTFHREAFFGTLRQIPALQREFFGTVNTEFLIEESL